MKDTDEEKLEKDEYESVCNEGMLKRRELMRTRERGMKRREGGEEEDKCRKKGMKK